jgi:hypothetical protein
MHLNRVRRALAHGESERPSDGSCCDQRQGAGRGCSRAHGALLSPSLSPQKVRKLSANRQRVPTVGTCKPAGHRLMPPLTNGCHLCGMSPRCTTTSDLQMPADLRLCVHDEALVRI